MVFQIPTNLTEIGTTRKRNAITVQVQSAK